MCEKNLEGKQLSLFPTDKDDILEETIVDSDVNSDSLITDDKDNIVVGASKRKRRSKKKLCKTCNQDITSLKKRYVMRYDNKSDQKLAKNYCKDHEISNSDHKCKPDWCGDCGFLIKYEISINFDKK